MKYLTLALAATSLAAMPAMACGAKTSEMKVVPASHHMTMQKDIVGTAEAKGFDTLLAAAKAAGLAEALQGDGPFTVFAPTDEAFAVLGEEKIAELLKPENKDTLAAILKYHVVAGEFKASDFVGKTTVVDTLGGKVTIDGRDGVTVNGVDVIKADVDASNGIIHAIDMVLMPPA